jgi:hypothetical protein
VVHGAPVNASLQPPEPASGLVAVSIVLCAAVIAGLAHHWGEETLAVVLYFVWLKIK